MHCSPFLNQFLVVAKLEPVSAGFEQIYIRRLNPSVVLRFVTPDGKELERSDESAPPNRVKNTVQPGTVVLPTIVPTRPNRPG